MAYASRLFCHGRYRTCLDRRKRYRRPMRLGGGCFSAVYSPRSPDVQHQPAPGGASSDPYAVEGLQSRTLPSRRSLVSPTSQPPFLMTRGDVAQLLGVELNKLTWWTWALDERRRYRDFDVAKRNGEVRTISAPIPPIKDIQRKLAMHLTRWYSPPVHVHGYVSGRDPKTNARPHRRQEWVLRADLKEFFPQRFTLVEFVVSLSLRLSTLAPMRRQ